MTENNEKKKEYINIGQAVCVAPILPDMKTFICKHDKRDKRRKPCRSCSWNPYYQSNFEPGKEIK